MKIENNNTNKGGVGFSGLLTVVLVTLKIAGITDMSWFWVFSPIIFLTISVLLAILAILIYVYFFRKEDWV